MGHLNQVVIDAANEFINSELLQEVAGVDADQLWTTINKKYPNDFIKSLQILQVCWNKFATNIDRLLFQKDIKEILICFNKECMSNDTYVTKQSKFTKDLKQTMRNVLE